MTEGCRHVPELQLQPLRRRNIHDDAVAHRRIGVAATTSIQSPKFDCWAAIRPSRGLGSSA
eukprot:16427849-Heterocapsa_arctica.AAC.1